MNRLKDIFGSNLIVDSGFVLISDEYFAWVITIHLHPSSLRLSLVHKDLFFSEPDDPLLEKVAYGVKVAPEEESAFHFGYTELGPHLDWRRQCIIPHLEPGEDLVKLLRDIEMGVDFMDILRGVAGGSIGGASGS